MVRARLYDGHSGYPHDVDARLNDGALRLTQDDGWAEDIPSELLRRVDSGRDAIRLGRSDVPGWRLLLAPEAEAEIGPLMARAERYGRWIDRVGLLPALVAGGLLTTAVLGVGYVAPHWLAPHVPMRWERNVGTAMFGDFGKRRCRNPDGQRALEALVERVAPGALRGPNPITVAALDVPIFNAAALPGGYIVVFRPAIDDTDADALAGIIAHEVAHVRRRHVTEALLRELGIGALVRLFAGNVGVNAEQIVALSYTRDNEAEADGNAIAMLRTSDISPRPTGELFRRLADEQGEGSGFGEEFLQSHPSSRSRASRFERAVDAKRPYRPALSEQQNAALHHICDKPPSN